MSALKRIACSPTYDVPVQPELFSKAAGEVIFLVIVVSGFTTWLFAPEVFSDNAIKTVIGYNSPCAFFDLPPANWLAVPMWSMVVYLNIRYSVLLHQRALIEGQSSTKRCLSLAVSLVYTASTMIVPLTLAVGPHEHWKMHFLAFGQLIPTRFMAVAQNYWLYTAEVTKPSLVFLIIYAILSVGEFGGILAAVCLYDSSWGAPDVGRPHVVPPAVQQTIDYLWFASLPLSSKFAPETPALQIDIRIAKGNETVDAERVGLSAAEPN